MKTLAAILVALSFSQGIDAQWQQVPDPLVRRTRAGDADLTAAAPRARARKPDLSGVWLADNNPIPEGILAVEAGQEFPRHFINIAADLPPDGLPLQPWAAELFEQRASTEAPAAFCKPTGVPHLNAVPLPLKIVQTQSLILILYEENGVFRQIFLDDRKPVEDALPRWMGYSTGRWEGAELVVDTVGFHDRHWLDGIGHPMSAQLHLIERFRRPDAGSLEIEVTVDDPGAYTKPFSYTVTYSLMPDDDLLEYFCTENEKDAGQHY
jgi:hypothetical protein